MINTRLTVLHELIFRSPEHAFRCFDATRREAPGLQRFVTLNEEKPNAGAHPLDECLVQFAVDLGRRMKRCAAVGCALHFVALLRTEQLDSAKEINEKKAPLAKVSSGISSDRRCAACRRDCVTGDRAEDRRSACDQGAPHFGETLLALDSE
jgi:hypothetical protein